MILEALASGTPVIGENLGGVNNVIFSEKTGLLCALGAVEDFTQTIVHLLTPDSLRWQMDMKRRKYALSQR